MAIVKMSKFDLVLFSQDKKNALRRLQKFQDVHLNDLADQESLLQQGALPFSDGKTRSALQEAMNRLEEAIRLLSRYQPAPSSLRECFSNRLPEIEKTVAEQQTGSVDIEAIAESVLEHQEQIRRTEEKVRGIQEERQELEHWKRLDISAQELGKLHSVHAQLGTIPRRWAENVNQFLNQHTDTLYMERIGGDTKWMYVFFLSRGTDEELAAFLRDVSFSPARLPQEGTVPERMAFLEQRRMECAKEIAEHTLWLKRQAAEALPMLKMQYELLSFKKQVLCAEESSVQTDRISFLQGYFPAEREEEFREALQKAISAERYVLDIAPADTEDEAVPIQLKNNKVLSPFESIVHTYALPLYKEMDPTALLAPWYILFFGLMMGDLGYGILLFIATTFALHFFSFKPSTEQSIRFFQILSIPTIIAGACFGSIFGGLIPMKALIIDPTTVYMPMIYFSLALGVVQLVTGLVIHAVQNFREHDPSAALYDAFSWIFILLGSIGGGMAMMKGWNPLYARIGFGFAILGGILVIFFSARENKGWGARIAWGIYNLYGATSYIGDIVSYSRITALMLSGAYIGYAVNLIAGMLKGAGVPGIIGAAVILLIFHLFNLFLSALSAYVHTIRLTYVEYFGKFYTGGGVPFHGLRPEAKYIDLK